MPDSIRDTTIFVRPLLRWYRQQGRSLPWRETSDPYHIWVSEVLLQQTQVSRAAEYYDRFIRRFPSVESLATARWPEVYAVWRGAGYYQRARNLMAAAKLIRKEYDGEVPEQRCDLESLPGIGKYTSAAIQSFAFGRNVPAIDTNFSRVFQRFFGCPVADVSARAEAIFSRLRSTGPELNHGVMDLGATVCKSRDPNCDDCPLMKCCDYAVNERGKSNLSAANRRKRYPGKTIIDVGIGCIHRKGRYLVGQRASSRGGSWEFPGGKREKGEDVRACLKREIKEELGVEVSVRPPFLTVDRIEKNCVFRLHFCRCRIQRGKVKAIEHEELAWLTPDEIQEIPFPKANAGAVKKLKKMKS